MSRDFDDIYKKIDQSRNGENINISKDINDIKKQIYDINNKIDMVLDILNNFTIMLSEDDEDMSENYLDDDNDNESWVPEQEEDWESYEDE